MMIHYAINSNRPLVAEALLDPAWWKDKAVPAAYLNQRTRRCNGAPTVIRESDHGHCTGLPDRSLRGQIPEENPFRSGAETVFYDQWPVGTPKYRFWAVYRLWLWPGLRGLHSVNSCFLSQRLIWLHRPRHFFLCAERGKV
jgi:hypothetical protein